MSSMKISHLESCKKSNDDDNIFQIKMMSEFKSDIYYIGRKRGVDEDSVAYKSILF